MEKKTIRVKVYTGDEQSITGNLSEIVGHLQDELDSIPAEYRNTAEIEIESEYDSSYSLLVEIFYWREETDDEANARIGHDSKAAEKRKQADLLLLANLKAKYPEAS